MRRTLGGYQLLCGLAGHEGNRECDIEALVLADGGSGGSNLHVRHPVVTFGFEARDLLWVVEGALRGMMMAAQAGATVVDSVDGLDACLIYSCTRGTSGTMMGRCRNGGRRRILGHFARGMRYKRGWTLSET
jgi:hypothetical protein